MWARISSSPWMLRLYSTVWALILIGIVFRLGTTYFSPAVGGLAALLLAVSPSLAATSQDIGPATEAAVLLLLNYACLLRAEFRKSAPRHWALYLLTGGLAVACHPLSLWVILVQAVLAFIGGPREERQNFYGRLLAHAGLIALFGWIWFRFTRSLEPAFQADWGTPTEWGLFPLMRLLGATAFWGTRVYPSGWVWTAVSIVLIAVPLIYGGLAIRHRQTQELTGFLGTTAVAPLILIFLLPRQYILTHCSTAEILTLTLAPLVLWASTALRHGMRDRPRQILSIVLVVGGLIVTPWSARVHPDWATYRDQIARAQLVAADRVARLADFEQYLGAKVRIVDISNLPELALTDDKSTKPLLVLQARSPLYEAGESPNSPAPLIRAWLRENCKPPRDLLPDDFFQLTQWPNFDPVKLREEINARTFYDPEMWKTERFVRWFGPYDAGFDRGGTASRLSHLSAPKRIGRLIGSSRIRWIFEPRVPPGFYHVFLPLHLMDETRASGVPLLLILPNGQRKRLVVTKETSGFSFRAWALKSF
jgi:hypothetical protein